MTPRETPVDPMSDQMTDTEHETVTLTDVRRDGDSWTITADWSFSYEASLAPDFTPKRGDVARFYGKGIGYAVRGLVIAGRTIFYRTDAAEKARHGAMVAADKAKRLAAFEAAGRATLDAKYAALPPVFQRRIDKFRRNNPEFRVEYEGYEMFCCEEAITLAVALKTTDAVREFSDLPYDQQKERVPGLAYAEHSGNTFGCAVQLAHLYLAQPDAVERMHGALAPLVGSEAYGG